MVSESKLLSLFPSATQLGIIYLRRNSSTISLACRTRAFNSSGFCRILCTDGTPDDSVSERRPASLQDAACGVDAAASRGATFFPAARVNGRQQTAIRVAAERNKAFRLP